MLRFYPLQNATHLFGDKVLEISVGQNLQQWKG